MTAFGHPASTAMRMRKPLQARRRQQGAGMIEVLIAVLILGIGLLGIAAMQSTALRNSQSALERSQAVIHTYAILDAMRANRQAALDGNYQMNMTCTPPASAGSLANADRRNWMLAMQAALGSDACGQINCPAGGAACTITIRWNDSRAEEGGVSGTDLANRSVQTTTLI